MDDGEIRRYQVPTHLRVDDRLTIGFLTCTFRQLTVLVLGGSAYEVWTQFPQAALAPLLGEALTIGVRIGGLIVLGPLTLALAFGRRKGRTLETWLLLWVQYTLQPRCYRWQRQPDLALLAPPPALPLGESEEGA
jgi:hypothetical protein